MNDDLQSALASNFNDLAAWVKSAAGASGDFIAREAPLFVQEYLAWEFWSHLAGAAICLFFVTVAAGLLIAGLRKFSESDGWIPVCVVSGFVVLCVTPGIFVNAYAAAKVKIAPRVVLVDKAAELAGMKK